MVGTVPGTIPSNRNAAFASSRSATAQLSRYAAVSAVSGLPSASKDIAFTSAPPNATPLALAHFESLRRSAVVVAASAKAPPVRPRSAGAVASVISVSGSAGQSWKPPPPSGSSRTWMALITACPEYWIVNSSDVPPAVKTPTSEPPYSQPVPPNRMVCSPSGAVADCVV